MGKSERHLKGWSKWPKEKLLETRICDLGLSLDGSILEARIQQLFRELLQAGFLFKPHFWLSDEWYCPDGVPGVAIPFYLAHPRLRRLEKDFILEVEGGNKVWCMKLLRHETGHALLNAYKLDRRRDWERHFGKPNLPYPHSYLPKPYSKRFVHNLPHWYAQSHPHEDWAETFSIWLRPDSNWRSRYKGWPAISKLDYVDRLMMEIKDQRPKLTNKRIVSPTDKIVITLKKYYQQKVEHYGSANPRFFDQELHWLFSDLVQQSNNEKASQYIRRVRTELIDVVCRWTSGYKYRINEVLDEMIERCDNLNLRVARSDDEMKPEIVACLTTLVINKLQSGGFHIMI